MMHINSVRLKTFRFLFPLPVWQVKKKKHLGYLKLVYYAENNNNKKKNAVKRRLEFNPSYHNLYMHFTFVTGFLKK